MSSTRLLLVDHSFHRLSESSQFFADVLATRFELSRLYVTPDARLDIDWNDVARHDIIVLWQVDYLAPLFLGRGYRTVVVPMFDGSSSLPKVHWSVARGARFINFSRSLHERIRLLGLDTMLVKYFPEPAAAAELPDFSDLRAFLWQRRPEHGINSELLGRLFGNQLGAVHIHDAPDDPHMAHRFGPPATIGRAPVTISRWVDTRTEYRSLLAACNVFVCPRQSEGIGLAMLEAMARGMLIVGNDQPCHNEYICNWVNGVLFHRSNLGEADFRDASRVARLGWQTVRDGHRRWLACLDRLLAFIEGAPRLRAAEPRLLAQFDRDLVPAYLAAGDLYESLLLRLLPAVGDRQPINAPEARRPVNAPEARRPVNASEASRPAAMLAAATVAPLPRVQAHRPPVAAVPVRTDGQCVVSLNFTNGAARPLLGAGWSRDEEFGVWIEGGRAELRFAADIDFPVGALALRVHALAPGPAANHTIVRISVNDVASGQPFVVRGGGRGGEARCWVVPDAPFTGGIWDMEFACDRIHTAEHDQRPLSVAILGLGIHFISQAELAAAAATPDTILVLNRSVGHILTGSAPRPKLARRPRGKHRAIGGAEPKTLEHIAEA